MKTYILLKDLPDAKAGTRLTSDGGNFYDYKGITDTDKDESYYSAEIVENSPDWFVEHSEVLKKYKTKPMDKKIKGYKAPFDMFSWGIKKGDLMIKAKEGQDYHVDGYLPSKLPSEIVETWEPVYEEEKEFTKSDLEKAFKAARESLGITGSRVKHESFDDYYATLKK